MPKDVTASPQSILLGFLTVGPRHPYELYQEFSRDLGRVWDIGQSHLYAYLKQLAESGLAEVKVEAPSKRPARNVYYITPAGREIFLNWLHQPTQHVRHIRLEFLARLYFFRRLKLPGLAELILSQKALLQTRIESLSHAISKTEDEYWRLVLDFRRGEMQAVIDWLDRCLEITSL
jgi:DNA-binding PadR family transcriptional regulator